ncbi:MAG: Fic family protein [Caldilineaceae bacterium]|nr:Fic family protein [Caldilineaceae bacterium]
MNPERFRDSPSGRLVKAGRRPHDYWTFVPNPLPPELSIDLGLIQKLSEADRALGELAGLGRAISNPHLLIRPFIRREAVLSSRIEGTQADIADLYAYEAGQLPLPGLKPVATPEADVQEVLNYVLALEYGVQRLQSLPISLRLIRELHEHLMRGVRGGHATPGEFRRSQNWIGAPGCTLDEADFVPPAVEDMQRALRALESYLHDESYPPLLRLALIHYQFEAIHPFLDGNGRIGRLLIILLMIHWQLLPAPLLYLSVYFHRHREQYYALLMQVSQEGAWRAWIAFFLEGVTSQAIDAIVRAKQLQDLQRDWHERLLSQGATGRMHGAVDLLFENPVVAAQDLMARLDVSHQTAMRMLRQLEEQEMLAQIGERQRNRRYWAKQIVDVVS